MYEIILTAVLLLLGYIVGTSVEKRHYRSIFKREKQLSSILLFDTRIIPNELEASGGQLVQGHVVISVDYFKRFVAGLRKLFGGKLKSYESLLDRGRREAVLRMKQQASEINANMVFNIKFETTSISKGAEGSIGSVEVYVYGSAVHANQ